MKKYGKFAALTAVILGTLGWLAVAGSGEAKSYYKTIAELRQMGPDAAKKRLRVAGDIEKDSIKRNGGEPWSHFNRGLAHSGRNDLDAALADFDAAIAKDANFGEAYHQRGRVHVPPPRAAVHQQAAAAAEA